MPKSKKHIKVRDLKPSKDAKGGGRHAPQGQGHSIAGKHDVLGKQGIQGKQGVAGTGPANN